MRPLAEYSNVLCLMFNYSDLIFFLFFSDGGAGRGGSSSWVRHIVQGQKGSTVQMFKFSFIVGGA